MKCQKSVKEWKCKSLKVKAFFWVPFQSNWPFHNPAFLAFISPLLDVYLSTRSNIPPSHLIGETASQNSIIAEVGEHLNSKYLTIFNFLFFWKLMIMYSCKAFMPHHNCVNEINIIWIIYAPDLHNYSHWYQLQASIQIKLQTKTILTKTKKKL